MLGHVGGRHIVYCQAICHFLWSYSKCCKYVFKRSEVYQVIFLHSAVFSTQLFIYHPCYFSTVLALILPCKILYVTGFAKIALNGTTTETRLTLKLHSSNIQTEKHMAIDCQVYFHRWSFAYPIKPWRFTTGPVGRQRMALIRMCVVPK